MREGGKRMEGSGEEREKRERGRVREEERKERRRMFRNSCQKDAHQYM